MPEAPAVEMFVIPLCPFCDRARALLRRHGVEWRERDMAQDPAARAEMRARTGGATSAPQIFIGKKHVGGSDALAALEAEGVLAGLLAG